jgi:hypothetical protein
MNYRKFYVLFLKKSGSLDDLSAQDICTRNCISKELTLYLSIGENGKIMFVAG